MSFKNDGSVHYAGIANEKEMCKLLTEVNHYGAEVIHQGGTKQVRDAYVKNLVDISIKNWKDKGTYDWYNTAPLAAEIGLDKIIKPFIEQFKKDIENVPDEDHKTYRKQEQDRLNKIIGSKIDDLWSPEIADKVINHFISHTKDMDVVVHHRIAKKVYIYKFDDHPVVSYYKKGYKPILIYKKDPNSASRTIFMEKDGHRVDTALRVRFTNTNSLKPYTNEPCSGKNKKNTSTSACLKLQQEKLDKLLANVPTVCYNY